MEIADVWIENTVKARKRHVCLSGIRILPGDEYVRVEYLMDGFWRRFCMHPGFQAWVDGLNAQASFDDRMAYEEWSDGDYRAEDLRGLLALFDSVGPERMPERVRADVVERVSRIEEYAGGRAWV